MSHKKQTERRLDVIKIEIEEVNLDTTPPIAQGRDRHQWGLLDIDLSHGVGGKFPTPQVGETWWVKRTTGRTWILDHKVDVNRNESVKTTGVSSDVGGPSSVTLGFQVRERKTHTEYEAFVTFDPLQVDVNGTVADHYLIDWVACKKNGTILPGQKVRQYPWDPNTSSDPPDDPASDYFVVLPGNVPNPKSWYYKARVRGIAVDGTRGMWSEWTNTILPVRQLDPTIPIPKNVTLDFRVHERKTHLEFRGVVEFDDIGYWTIPGGDYEDDIGKYAVILQPLMIDDSAVPGDGKWITSASVVFPFDSTAPPAVHQFVRADPNHDGKPLYAKRIAIHDKDDLDGFDHLGTLDGPDESTPSSGDIDDVETFILAHEDITAPAVPFIIMIDDEKMVVVDRMPFQFTDPCEEIDPGLIQYEVIRQFENTEAASHTEGTEILYDDKPYRYKAVFTHIGRPKTIFWRTRVRAIDRFNRRGLPSEWVGPVLPWNNVEDKPPFPTGLALDFDKVERDRHHMWRAIARWDEMQYDVPGGDKESDVAHYGIQLEANDLRTLSVSCGSGDTTITVNEVVRPSEADSLPFRIEIDNEVMAVTNRPTDTSANWVAGNKTYTVTRGVSIPNSGFDSTTPASHTAGALVWKRPPRHKMVSAKLDNDANNFANASFPKVHHRWFFRAKARTVDRFNRRSDWSPWTPAGSPSDTTPPPPPTNVAVEISQHVLHVTWDAPIDPADADIITPKLLLLHEDIAYFQVQLSNDSGFAVGTIIRFDRYTKHTSKTWKIQKPKGLTFYGRVRSVDASGNRSAWIPASSVNGVPPTPSIENFTFEKMGTRHARLRAIVNVSTVTFADEEIGQYIVQFIKKPHNVLPPANPTVGDHREVHRIEGDANQLGDPTDDDMHTIFHNIPRRHWVFARVRSQDAQGRKSMWSGWTGQEARAGKPPNPTNVATSKTKARVAIHWKPPMDPYNDGYPHEDVTHYNVQISLNDPSFNTTVVDSKHVVNTHYRHVVAPADQGTPHYLRVQSVDSNGEVGDWMGDVPQTADSDSATSGAEPGTVRMFAQGSIPGGPNGPTWLKCDGSLYSTVVYNALFQVIGHDFAHPPGSDPAGLFSVPDMKNRKVISEGNRFTRATDDGDIETNRTQDHDPHGPHNPHGEHGSHGTHGGHNTDSSHTHAYGGDNTSQQSFGDNLDNVGTGGPGGRQASKPNHFHTISGFTNASGGSGHGSTHDVAGWFGFGHPHHDSTAGGIDNVKGHRTHDNDNTGQGGGHDKHIEHKKHHFIVMVHAIKT